MYLQNNHLYDSVGRRLSTNPFRQNSYLSVVQPAAGGNRSVSPVALTNSAFDDWVNRNRGLMTDLSDEEDVIFQRPSFPSLTRTGSDTNVNYNRKMSSNNPFASAMAGEYKHHRDPPPPPPQATRIRSPSKRSESLKKMAPPPPSYEEAAGPKAESKVYPKEKESLKLSSRSSRPHRSHSDSAKHKERKSRHKSSKESKKKAVAPHQPKHLDVIDKLDVSAFFGGRFHHDGPFDACAPHRNKNVKAAPVMAFPADGPNNSMKASAVPKDNMDMAFGNFEDHNMIVGRTAREHSSSIGSSQPRALGQSTELPRLTPSVVAFDANEKAAPIHGYATAGLGSTTFLNGAPAPKSEEFLSPPKPIKTLGRKKSLVQRLRKNSGSESTSRRSSDDSVEEYRRPSYNEDEGPSSLLQRVKSLKVGRK